MVRFRIDSRLHERTTRAFDNLIGGQNRHPVSTFIKYAAFFLGIASARTKVYRTVLRSATSNFISSELGVIDVNGVVLVFHRSILTFVVERETLAERRLCCGLRTT